jgi:hypothetical protein
MTTLAQVNDTLLEVSNNTKETSKGISAFVKYIEKQKAKDLEAEREAKANEKKIVKAEARANNSSSGGGFGSNFKAGLAGLGAGGLLGLGTRVGSAVLKRLPGLGLIGFSDQIADAILGDDFPKDFKDTVSRGIQGAGFGMLLGKRFIPIFAALGLLATEENKGILKDIGTNVKEKWDKFAENLKPILGFLPSFDNIVKFIGGSVTKGLTAIKGFTESGFDNEEFKKNWGSAIGLLGSVAFLLMPGKFLKALKFLAKFALTKKGLISLIGAAAAGKIGMDLFGENGTFGGDTALASAALAAGTGYLGFKAIKGLTNRGAPTADDDAARSKQAKSQPNIKRYAKGTKINGKNVGGQLYNADKTPKDMDMSKKYPRIFSKSGVLKFLKGFGPLAALSAIFAMSEVQDVLASSASEEEKKKQLGGILGTELNSMAFAGIGAAIGGLGIGPKGAVLGGGIGAILGMLAPNVAGEMLADFFMGGNPKMNESQKNLMGSLSEVRKKANAKDMYGGQFQDISSSIGLTSPDLKFAKNDYNQRLKNNMYNMEGVGQAGVNNISTGNKLNSDNINANVVNNNQTALISSGPTIDMKDQFGFGT